jgi:hypothetical protein
MKMKKVTSMVLCSILISASIPMGFNVQALDSKNASSTIYTVAGAQVTNESIRTVIDNYFNWHYKSLKEKNNNDKDALNSMVINNNLINFKKTKLKWMSEWYNNTDKEIKDYKIYTDINKIIVEEDTIYVTATYGEDLILNSEDVVQQRRNQEHKIVLKNLKNNLVIANDYYNDELSDEFFMVPDEEFKAVETNSNINKKLDIKSNEFNINLDKITELATEYKNQLQLASSIGKLDNTSKSDYNYGVTAYSNYNGNAAKVYAVDYALKYNPNYSRYDGVGQGGDCTNFASQCIKEGGIPIDGTWFKDSNAWIRVIALRNWLINKGYARELTWQENAKEGDLVQLKDSDGIWYHSLVITYKGTGGELYVSCHSGNARNVAITNYTTSRRYLILTS